MTPEEAIKILKPLFEQCKGKNECLGYIEHFFTKDEEEALEMAIKALEQQLCEGMRDATEEERKSTKDYIDSISKPTGVQFDDIYEELNFVQPHKKISVNLQPCEDCISREAVKKLKKYRLSYDTNTTIPKSDIFVKIADIEELPSVQPQRSKGKWILKHRKHNSMKWLTGTDEYGVEHTVKKYEEYECDEPYCSVCGKLAGDTSQNYCPNCGADMRENEE